MFIPATESLDPTPTLVVALTDPVAAAAISRACRLRGWDAYQAETGQLARFFVRTFAAATLILDVALPDESGWLTCAKLIEECPQVKVILLGDGLDPESDALAAFVGASAFVRRGEDLSVLLREIHDPALHAAS
jgi:DNA-binding response OmpR family regulator